MPAIKNAVRLPKIASAIRMLPAKNVIENCILESFMEMVDFAILGSACLAKALLLPRLEMDIAAQTLLRPTLQFGKARVPAGPVSLGHFLFLCTELR